MSIGIPRFLKDSQNGYYSCAESNPETAPNEGGIKEKRPIHLTLTNLRTGEKTLLKKDSTSVIPDGYSLADPSSVIALKLSQKEYDATLGERLGRCTLGRISCLARVPIYVLGGLFLSAMTIVKFFAAFPVTLLALCSNNPHLESWTFSAMIREGIAALILFDKAANSTLCFLFAPPTKYRSFSDAVTDTIEITVTERKHQKFYEWNNRHMPVEYVWKNFVDYRCPLHSIFENEILKNPLASYENNVDPYIYAG